MNEDELHLARERALADEIQRLSDLTVAELIEEVGVIQVRIGDVCGHPESWNRGAGFPLDLQALIEKIAEAGL